MNKKKLFLTSWPSGDFKLVEVIEKHPSIKDGWYIRYGSGGTDTTTEEFLFDVPVEISDDTKRIDWLADPEQFTGSIQLPTKCVENNLHSLRAAIDEAMAL